MHVHVNTPREDDVSKKGEGCHHTGVFLQKYTFSPCKPRHSDSSELGILL